MASLVAKAPGAWGGWEWEWGENRGRTSIQGAGDFFRRF